MIKTSSFSLGQLIYQMPGLHPILANSPAQWLLKACQLLQASRMSGPPECPVLQVEEMSLDFSIKANVYLCHWALFFPRVLQLLHVGLSSKLFLLRKQLPVERPNNSHWILLYTGIDRRRTAFPNTFPHERRYRKFRNIPEWSSPTINKWKR